MKKILIVEDNPDLESVFRKMYESKGLNVEFNLEDDRLYSWNETNKPEIIQLDGLNGRWEPTYERLRKGNPEAKYFLYSGSHEFKESALEKGIGFLSKPKTQKILIEYINQLQSINQLS